MASQSSLKTIDLQKLISGTAKLELKALHAGVQCVQVWVNQAAKLSNITSDTLQAIQDGKGSLSDAVLRFTEFSKDNAEVFGDLSSRLSKSYYDEIGQIATAVRSNVGKLTPTKKTVRRRPTPRKKAHS